MSKYVFSTLGEDYYFRDMFSLIGYKFTAHIEQADLILFPGGSDVDPLLYGEVAHAKCGRTNPSRDQREMFIYRVSKEKGVPMLGICRGAQFLCVMNGGKLYQHVHNHAMHGLHQIVTCNGETYHVSSTHHQMMRPEESTNAYHMLAWAEGLSDVHITQDGDKGEVEMEPEIVWWPESKSLCIQGHPEIMGRSPNLDYLLSLITTYCGGN